MIGHTKKPRPLGHSGAVCSSTGCQRARRKWTCHQWLFLAIGAFLLSRRGTLAPVLSIGGQGSEVQAVEEKIKGSKVFLISKEYCPFCQKAKSVLSDLGVDVEVLELADKNKQPLVDDPAAIMDYMEKITGGRTVPRLFIAGKFVGGCEHASVSRALTASSCI